MMYTNNEPIRRIINKNKVLIAAHRGTCGGNVIQNTCLAYRNALLHGADLIEVDASMTTDGVFFAFHDGEEILEFGIDKDIKQMSSAEVEQLQTLNSLRHKTNQKVERLDFVLEAFRGKCLINIDRSWFYWKEIISFLKSKDMNDQILVKSYPEEELLKVLEENCPEIMYMPILKKPEDWEIVKNYNINVAAVELIFEQMDSKFISKEFIDELHKKGIIAWVNAITLDDETFLSAELDDNHAIAEDFDRNWGKLIDMGFDIIQTDWPALLKEYIKRR